MKDFGKIILTIGLLMTVSGVILVLFSDRLSWLGRLPGDIRLEKKNSYSLYIPITTMLILSIVLSVLWNLLARFFK